MKDSKTDFSVPLPAVIRTAGARLGWVDGQPMLMAGSRPFFGFMYTFDPYENRPYLKSFRSMYRQGVRLFSFLAPLPVTWQRDGSFDFTLLDRLHDELLSAGPDALFMPRVFLATPDWWDERHPDELIGFRGGRPPVERFESERTPLWKYETKIYHGTSNPSLASERWRQDAGRALAAYVRHTWQKHPGHFFGYQMAYGCCGEWGAYGHYFQNRYGSYDFSPPMLRGFRRFLKTRYFSDEALRKAWDDRRVTFADAEPPDKIQTLETDVGMLKDPRRHRHYADWVTHYSRTLYSAMLHFGAVAKAAAPAPVLTLAFAGYRVQVGCSAYVAHLAQTDLNGLLDGDGLDALSTPNAYENRARGVFSQAPVATIARRKLFWAENDVRTHLASPAEERFGPGGLAPEIGIRGFKRDTFYNFIQGGGHLWWYDFGLGWYLDPGIEQVVRRLVRAAARLHPSIRKGQAEIALVADEASLLYMEGMPQYFVLCREWMNEELPRCGTPFDVITGDDVLQRPPYRLYLFRDMFYVAARQRSRLRAFLEKHKASAVWCHAAGLLSERGINPAGAEQLTGIRLRLLEKMITSQQLTVLNFEHPVTRGAPSTQGTRGNDDQRGIYGPMLVCDDPAATILGQIESVGLPGLAFKTRRGAFDLWCASPLLTHELVANIAAAAGVRRVVPPGVTVFGQGRLLAVSSPIRRVISLHPPQRTTAVRDLLTGRRRPVRHGVCRLALAANEPLLLEAE